MIYLLALFAALSPGTSEVYTAGAREGRLGGTVKFGVEKGEKKGTLVLTHEFATADLGPLTLRTRLRAILDIETARFTSFIYEVAGKETDYRMRARLGPAPDREGALLHERFDRDASGKTRTKKSWFRPGGAWVPDLLEPFVVGLFLKEEEKAATFRVVTVERGRYHKTPVTLERIGEGKKEVGGEKVPVIILTRAKGESSSIVYLRKRSLLPVKYPPAALTWRPSPKPDGAQKEKDR